MFNLKLGPTATMYSIEAFVFNLEQSRISEIREARELDGTINIDLKINGISLTQHEITKALESMFTALTFSYRERLNKILRKERNFLKHKYSNVEKEVNKQVKAKLNSSATLIADNALSQLGKIQKEITKLRNTVASHSLK